MVNKQLSEKEALIKLTALCSRAEHCSGEMLDKMRKWEIPENVQARIMAYLTENKYIDDTRFCHAFILDKIRYNKWGRRKVEQALWQKHVPNDIYTPILNDIDDEEYLRVLRPLLKSKRKSTKAASEYELNTKLFRFAMSRGFTVDIIRQCLDTDDDPEDI